MVRKLIFITLTTHVKPTWLFVTRYVETLTYNLRFLANLLRTLDHCGSWFACHSQQSADSGALAAKTSRTSENAAVHYPLRMKLYEGYVETSESAEVIIRCTEISL